MGIGTQIAMVLFMSILTIGVVYSIYKDQLTANRRFELQMEASKAQSSMTNPLKFEDCRTIINGIVNFYCIMEDIKHGYYKKTPEEFSLVMDRVITQVALQARMALSDELVRQFGKFATITGEDNYLDAYILNTTKIALMDEINNRRKTVTTQEPLVPKNGPKGHNK